MYMNIKGFERMEFPSNSITHTLYVSRIGRKPIVLLHELPGLSDECQKLGRWLSQQGYKVFMPLFVGKPGERKPLRNMFCIRREMGLFAKGKSGPVLHWLKALCRKARDDCNADGVGVIGMCMTGNFAIALIADDSVLAPVTCQPALPVLRKKTDLAMTDETLNKAKSRARSLPQPALLGFRYELDKVCPAAKWERLRAEFGSSVNAVELPGAGHSTLTNPDFWKTDDPAAHPIFRQLLDFLKARLRS